MFELVKPWSWFDKNKNMDRISNVRNMCILFSDNMYLNPKFGEKETYVVKLNHQNDHLKVFL